MFDSVGEVQNGPMGVVEWRSSLQDGRQDGSRPLKVARNRLFGVDFGIEDLAGRRKANTPLE